MDKLKLLLEKCANAVYIEYNAHKSAYVTVEKYLFGVEVYEVENQDIIDETTQEVIDEMIKRNTCVRIQFYPRTSVSFYRIYHYDIETAIDVALEALESEGILSVTQVR